MLLDLLPLFDEATPAHDTTATAGPSYHGPRWLRTSSTIVVSVTFTAGPPLLDETLLLLLLLDE